MTSPAIVTGASGFVGRALLARLPHAVGIPLAPDDWRRGVDAAPWRDASVFHLAARVHEAGAGEALYARDNVEKTAAIAEAAARGGARRLVFLSTIKVNGEETREQPFRPGDEPAPSDAYARSKWQAEQRLEAACERGGLSFAVLRSPLVVGPGAAGNLHALARLAATPCPLPFLSLDNRRTLVAVDDLAALLVACAEAPDAAGRLFFAGDSRPVSTVELVTVIRAAWSRSARLFRVPAALLEALATMAGQGERMRRLTRSLEVDVTETLRDLPWAPRVRIEDAVADMARAYRTGIART